MEYRIIGLNFNFYTNACEKKFVKFQNNFVLTLTLIKKNLF